MAVLKEFRFTSTHWTCDRTSTCVGRRFGSGNSITFHGELMQNDTTSNMIYNVRQVIAFISRGQTIEAGSVIAMGTMGGIGDTRTPRVVLQNNDVVTVTIEKIGSLTNTIRREEVEKEEQVFPVQERNGTKAGRVIRFLDVHGSIMYGEPVEVNGHVVQAKLIESNDLFGSEYLLEMLSPMRSRPDRSRPNNRNRPELRSTAPRRTCRTSAPIVFFRTERVLFPLTMMFRFKTYRSTGLRG